ncbi:MAG: acyl-CoA thioesterase [Acidobacteriota bacterium]
MKSSVPFVARRTVEFSDSDMGGVVHFSRYLVYMETAEHQFLRSRGIEVHAEFEGRLLSWPRVAIRCEYRQAARFRDAIDIEVRVLRRGTRSVTYGFRLRRADEDLATGEMTAVCCVVDPGTGTLQSVEIPAAIAAAIGEGERDGTS